MIRLAYIFVLLAGTALVLPSLANAATPEQAERAKACNLPEGTIENSLEKEPLIAAIKDTLPHAGRGEGPVQIFEFFDYNCPTCRAIAPQWIKIDEGTDNVRIDFIEIGVFGRGSRKAAHIGLAILEQSPADYIAYHEGLMLTPGKSNTKKAKRVLETLNLDTDAVTMRAGEDDISAQRKANEDYFVSLGMRATPGLIVDGIIIPADNKIGPNLSCVMKYARQTAAAQSTASQAQ